MAKKTPSPSWMDKELKRREAGDKGGRAVPSSMLSNPDPGEEPLGLAGLWDSLEKANEALPAPLKLHRELGKLDNVMINPQRIRVWLVAANGAAIGQADNGLRYVWPKDNQHKRLNFWIRVRNDGTLVLVRKLRWSWSGASSKEQKLKPEPVEHIIKCLVTGVLIKHKKISRGGWFGLW